MREQAQSRGVSGWVRNCADGSVEALVSGPDEAVEALIAALHEGPPNANVEKVTVTEADAPPEPGFRILR